MTLVQLIYLKESTVRSSPSPEGKIPCSLSLPYPALADMFMQVLAAFTHCQLRQISKNSTGKDTQLELVTITPFSGKGSEGYLTILKRRTSQIHVLNTFRRFSVFADCLIHFNGIRSHQCQLHKKALIIYLHWVLCCVVMQSKQVFCNLEICDNDLEH